MSEKAKGKKSFHYAWIILIGCCCCAAGSYGAIFNVVAVYALPVSQSIGVGVGDWMLWLTVSSICSCIALPFWGKWLQTKNFNVVTTAAALLSVVSVFMFSFGTNLIWYLVWGAVLGCGLTCIGALVTPLLIGNWFAESRRGLFLGIATAFTGLGAFVFAPMFTQIVQSLGWQNAYLINGTLSAVLMLPFTAILFTNDQIL